MKRFRKYLTAAYAVALCLIAVGLIVWAQRQARVMNRFIAGGPAALIREQAAARQAGIPLDAGQLQQPLPPPSQNAAPLYVTLAKLLHDRPLGLPPYAEGMDAFHSYTPAQISAVRKTLAARPDVMALVHQAAARPQCVFVRDWGQGINLKFPEYHTVREAARLLKTESFLLAHDGHVQEAVSTQALGFWVAGHAASDPILIAYLVGGACDSLTLSGMQSILALAGPNPTVDVAVRRMVEAGRPGPSLRRAMAGQAGFDYTNLVNMHQHERYGVEGAVDDGMPEKDGGGPGRPRQPVSASEQARTRNAIDAWQADYLARMRPLVLASVLPPTERRAAFAAAYRDLARASQSPTGPTHLLTGVLMPPFTEIDETDTRLHAREAITLAAAAVLAERAKTGRLTDKLSQEDADPFTNRTLGYRREGAGGFVVYSAGPTGHFDGGRPGRGTPRVESLFRYPAVPLPPAH